MKFSNDFNQVLQNLDATDNIIDLFAHEPQRFERMDLFCDQLRVNASRNSLSLQNLEALISAATDSGLEDARSALFGGKKINFTENRSVLHTQLRQSSSSAESLRRQTHDQIARLLSLLEHNRITDLVVIGMGGSVLGPELMISALSQSLQSSIQCHFINNLDAHRIDLLLKKLDVATTQICVISKSFTTQETLENASLMMNWVEQHNSNVQIQDHFIAITANHTLARSYGLSEDRILSFADGVGGRFSLWSTVGFPIALVFGHEAFESFLDGAQAMDQHFVDSKLSENIPVLLALVGIWYRNVHNSASYAVVPYDDRLANLPLYLQQLDMESNGKSVNRDGMPTGYETGPVCFGGVGTGVQHAFFQWLHQGTSAVPVDLIGVRQPNHAHMDHHSKLLMNLLSQSESLMLGQTQQQARQLMIEQGVSHADADRLAAHRTYPGNRPSNLIFVEQLSARALGNLLAMYEHKIFVQGCLWDINSFDQWGVELGKQRCEALLDDGHQASDPVTDSYLNWLNTRI